MNLAVLATGRHKTIMQPKCEMALSRMRRAVAAKLKG
jgi:hypothetical protein